MPSRDQSSSGRASAFWGHHRPALNSSHASRVNASSASSAAMRLWAAASSSDTITEIHQRSRGTYSGRRVRAALLADTR